MARVSARAPAAPMTIPARASPSPRPGDKAEHIGAARAERHPDADFCRALRDRVGHHPVNSYRRESDGQGRERTEDDRLHVLLLEFMIDNRTQRLHVDTGCSGSAE